MDSFELSAEVAAALHALRSVTIEDMEVCEEDKDLIILNTINLLSKIKDFLSELSNRV